MDSYEKVIEAGTILTFTVSDEFRPYYDFTSDVAYADVNSWEVHKPHEESDNWSSIGGTALLSPTTTMMTMGSS